MLPVAPGTRSGWRSGYRLATNRATEQGSRELDNCANTLGTKRREEK